MHSDGSHYAPLHFLSYVYTWAYNSHFERAEFWLQLALLVHSRLCCLRHIPVPILCTHGELGEQASGTTIRVETLAGCAGDQVFGERRGDCSLIVLRPGGRRPCARLRHCSCCVSSRGGCCVHRCLLPCVRSCCCAPALFEWLHCVPLPASCPDRLNRTTCYVD